MFIKKEIELKKKHQVLIIIIIILVISGLFFLPVKVPFIIDSVAKILPARQWILYRGNDGEIITNTVNNLNVTNSIYQRISFERGESIILDMGPANRLNIAAKGDTLGYIYSSARQADLIRLKGELDVLNAAVKAGMSGDKKTEVQAAEQRLALAVSEVDKQTKIVDRLKKLLEKDIIAKAEYQEEADELYTLTKAVKIRQAELESSLSGEKAEEIEMLKKQITAVNNEISFLQRQIDSQNIITAPFSGRLDRSFSNDTLLVLSNFDLGVGYIPVHLAEADYISDDGRVSFKSNSQAAELSGKVLKKHPAMKMIGGKQCMIVLTDVSPLTNDFVSGSLAQAKINCGQIALQTYLIRNIFN